MTGQFRVPPIPGKRHRRVAGFLVVLAPLLLGFTCHGSDEGSAAAAGLEGSSWQLVKFQGSGGKTLTPADPTKYIVAFDKGGAVSLRVDCNRGRGTWKSSGPNQLQFGPLALTRAMCPPDPLNDRIPRDWTYVRSYTIKDGHLFLSLKADDGGTYEFRPMVVLENTHWKLTHFEEAPVSQSQREPNLVLNSDTHRVTGSGGCNSLSGSYELGGNHLTFSKVATTMMMCANGMDTETGFLGALSKVKTWSIAGQELRLLDGDGHVLATLEGASQ